MASIQLKTNVAPNQAAVVAESARGLFTIKYADQLIFQGRFKNGAGRTLRGVDLRIANQAGPNNSITQSIIISNPQIHGFISLEGTVFGSDQSFAAQLSRDRTPLTMVVNQIGRSNNRLNDAVYDRYRDWALEGQGSVSVWPEPSKSKSWEWGLKVSGRGKVALNFLPAYYRVHKNIAYFEPWNYRPKQESITGWCSWWAYMDQINQQDVQEISKIFHDKLKDYGYKIIQIDDGYQHSTSGTLADWLNTNPKFPAGLTGLADSIRSEGLIPALWMNVHFDDLQTLQNHPDWFIQDSPGHPHKGPWIDYALNPDSGAAKALITPHFAALKKEGFEYVKIDTLRHFMYDSMYPSREELAKQGQTPEHLLREYMRLARTALGPNTYILSCWGVLPEVVGYADGCRLGTDGYGPATLQQYTSWNNVVWRNDPDHCDLEPIGKDGKPQSGQERLRATLASVAGAQLLLSDKPDVYEKPAVLDAARRVSPVLFTLPGQLFDFDPSKANNLIEGLRNLNGGSKPGPIDADQFGKVCPWWLLDINEPYESWQVLTEMNWEKSALPAQTIRFADLGLSSQARYLVFEGWSETFLGLHSRQFDVPALPENGVKAYAIRRLLNHPQIVSTNRHISQGAVDLEGVSWNSRTRILHAEVNLVKGFPDRIFLHVGSGFKLESAEIGGETMHFKARPDGLVELEFTSSKTHKVAMSLKFSRS